MTLSRWQRVAVWLLWHAGPPNHRDALVGDVLEVLASGASQVWLWRQVSMTLLHALPRPFAKRVARSGLPHLIKAALIAAAAALLGAGTLAWASTPHVEACVQCAKTP